MFHFTCSMHNHVGSFLWVDEIHNFEESKQPPHSPHNDLRPHDHRPLRPASRQGSSVLCCWGFLFLFHFNSYNFYCVKLLTIYYSVRVSFLV
jgi:hypothetical protein